MNLPLPDSYDPDRFGTFYAARKEQLAEEAAEFAEQHDISPAKHDRTKRAMFGIDCQIDFCFDDEAEQTGALAVPGALEDMQTAVEFMYRNLDQISGLQFSMDTHRVFQIFHAAFWEDEDGNHPDPMTTITTEDLDAGHWRPVANPTLAREYVEKIDASDQYTLTIWPYHTLLGDLGHALVPPVFEAAVFHSVARSHQTHLETKGTKTMTEHFSVLEPEVKELGGLGIGHFSTDFYETLLNYDKVGIFGEASSHCVRETLKSLRQKIQKDDPSLADKIYVFEDCMSPVEPPPLDPLPEALNFPKQAQKTLEESEKFGFNVVTTENPGDFLD